METLSIRFKRQPLQGRVEIPGSKSISNRLLVMAYMAAPEAVGACRPAGGLRLERLSSSDDTVLMRRLLDEVTAGRARGAVDGSGGAAVRLDCDNAGTVLRFLTALLAFESGHWLLDGSARMRRRPIGPLVDSLRAAGADIGYMGENGCPPLRINGRPAAGAGRDWRVDGSISSQYVSALMLAACRVPGGVRLHLQGDRAVSQPYIRMTAELLRQQGVRVQAVADGFHVQGLPVFGAAVSVEPDWSSASYVYGLLALGEGGEIRLPGFRKDSCQGDGVLVDWFEAWGVESRFDSGGLWLCRREKRCPAAVALDFTQNPDLFQTMAVVCAGSGAEARLTGLRNLKYKETDRVAAVVTELQRLGVAVDVCGPDEIRLRPATGGRRVGSAETIGSAEIPLIHTYGDHRMALAFSMLAVQRPVRIENPSVANKSFDTYWTSLEDLGAETARRD